MAIVAVFYLVFLFFLWSLCRISALSDAKLEEMYLDPTADN
jgi:hypothetical protein